MRACCRGGCETFAIVFARAQARLDEDTANLAKQQQNFQRDREAMPQPHEEVYEKLVEESKFRCVCLCALACACVRPCKFAHACPQPIAG